MSSLPNCQVTPQGPFLIHEGASVAIQMMARSKVHLVLALSHHNKFQMLPEIAVLFVVSDLHAIIQTFVHPNVLKEGSLLA